MQRDREAGVGRRLPDRVVDRVVERTPVDRRVRTHEHRHHARQLGDPTDLGGDARRRRRARASAEPHPHRTAGPRLRGCGRNTSRCTRAPAPRRSRCRACSAARGASSGTAPRGRCRPGPCPAGAPWRSTPPDEPRCSAARRGTTRAVFVAHPGGAGCGHGVAGQAVAVEVQPLLALRVGLEVPDAIAVLGRRVVGHRRRVFEDVTVRVDVAQATIGSGGRHGEPPRTLDDCEPADDPTGKRRWASRAASGP